MDYGLLQGIGEGGKAFMEAYQGALKNKQDQEWKQKAFDIQIQNQKAEFANKGLIQTPDGSFEQSPYEQQQRDLKTRLVESEIQKNLRGKEVDPLTSAFKQERLEKMQKEKTPSGRLEKLSADAKMKMGMIGTSLQNITDMENMVEKDPSIPYDMTQIPLVGKYVFSKKEINNIRDRLADDIGRLKSGAAITAAEESRFRGFLPQEGDNPTAVSNKLTKLRNEFNIKLANFGMTPEDYTAALPGTNPAALGIGLDPIEKRMRARGLIKDSAKGKVGAGLVSGERTSEDVQALSWAKQNPTDPKAIQILKINGL